MTCFKIKFPNLGFDNCVLIFVPMEYFVNVF